MLIEEGITKYATYPIRGMDKNGGLEIFHRYSNFLKIRSTLISRWPGCYIPPVPPKQTVGNLDLKFLQQRRVLLEQFMKSISKREFIWYSEEFQVFLRNPGDVEKNLAFFKLNVPDMIEKYQVSFSSLSGKQINEELMLKIQNFDSYLKKVGSILNSFKEIAQNLTVSRQQSNDHLNSLSWHLLPEYERNCLSENLQHNVDGRLIFSDTQDPRNTELINQLKEITSQTEFEKLYWMILMECSEIQAFQEAINTFNNYENQKLKIANKHQDLVNDLEKIMKGQSTIQSVFSNKSKDDIIQDYQQDTEIVSTQQTNDLI